MSPGASFGTTTWVHPPPAWRWGRTVRTHADRDIGIGMVIRTGAAVCHGGLQRAVRQELAPDELQGRAQATGAWLAFSLRPFAALAAGGLGTWLGLHLTLTLITAALVIPFLVLWNSPVRRLRGSIRSRSRSRSPLPVSWPSGC
jgi:hypothetical protein